MLPHLASRIFGTPLLVQRAKLDVILAALSERLALAPPDVELAPPLPRAPNPAAFPSSSIAVLPIHGTLVKRTLGLEAASGLTSYQDLGAMLDAALADPQVAGILLDLDSPGGETGGCFECARRVREASRLKPVWAVANDAAFSAAYAIGCAADRLYVTETGGVGSIGVIALHLDQSARDAQEGLRYTAVVAGAHKNDYSPHAPLSEPAHAALQAEVDRLQAIFVAHVTAMRRLDEDAVRATDAALFFGPKAVEAGLADAVASLEAALTEFADVLIARRRQPPQARARAPAEAAHLTKEDLMPTDTELSDTLDEPRAAEAAADLLEARAAEARRDAILEVSQSARAIAELCLIGGCPERAAEFIAAGRGEAEVRRLLLEARASRSEGATVRSVHAPKDWAAPAADPAASPVVAAVKKLIHKE